jgi:hypothetical protein
MNDTDSEEIFSKSVKPTKQLTVDTFALKFILNDQPTFNDQSNRSYTSRIVYCLNDFRKLIERQEDLTMLDFMFMLVMSTGMMDLREAGIRIPAIRNATPIHHWFQTSFFPLNWKFELELSEKWTVQSNSLEAHLSLISRCILYINTKGKESKLSEFVTYTLSTIKHSLVVMDPTSPQETKIVDLSRVTFPSEWLPFNQGKATGILPPDHSSNKTKLIEANKLSEVILEMLTSIPDHECPGKELNRPEDFSGILGTSLLNVDSTTIKNRLTSEKSITRLRVIILTTFEVIRHSPQWVKPHFTTISSQVMECATYAGFVLNNDKAKMLTPEVNEVLAKARRLINEY